MRIRALTQTHRTEASDKGTRLSETGQEAVGERPPCLTSCLNPASALHHLKCPNYGLADLREAERDGSDETLKGRGRYVSDMLCVLSRCLCLGVLGLVLFALCRCAGCELRMRVCVSACVWGVDSPVHVVGHTLIIWACNAHASLTKDELHRSEQHSRTPAPPLPSNTGLYYTAQRTLSSWSSWNQYGQGSITSHHPFKSPTLPTGPIDVAEADTEHLHANAGAPDSSATRYRVNYRTFT